MPDTRYLSVLDMEDFEGIKLKDTEIRSAVGVLSQLKTPVKSDIVNAINSIYMQQFNVKAYGAVGDGVTDDTQAFKDAIDAVPVHGTLYVPMGTYLISDTLTIDKPMRLLGDYSGWDVEERTTDITNAEFKESLLKFTNNSLAIKVAILGFTMENISILKTVGGSGIDIDNSLALVAAFDRFNTIINCSISNLGDYTSSFGLGITFAGLTLIERVHVYGFEIGFFIQGNINTSMSVINCWAQNYHGTGWNIRGCSYSSFINCAADTLTATANGYVIRECFGTDFIDCGAEQNETGFYIDASEQIGISGLTAASSTSLNGICLREGSDVVIKNFRVANVTNPDYYPLRISHSGSKVILMNTNIDKIYNVEEEYVCTTGGFYESNVTQGAFTFK